MEKLDMFTSQSLQFIGELFSTSRHAEHQQLWEENRWFTILPLSSILGTEDTEDLLLCPVQALKRSVEVTEFHEAEEVIIHTSVGQK